MRVKLLYGLFLSSIFISIDAHESKVINASTSEQGAPQVTITNPITKSSTTIASGVSPTYSRNVSTPLRTAQNGHGYDGLHSTNVAGGSTTASRTPSGPQVVHTNPVGGSAYVTNNSAMHTNIAGGSTKVYNSEDTNYVTHTRSNIAGANNIVSTTIDRSDNGSSGGGHTNIAGGSTWGEKDSSGFNGVHYASQSVAIPIGGTTITSTQTDTASDKS